MTFTEAAIEVLRREGKPLHFKKLTEIAIRENLLDHVGKIPEDTMADQLAAHCRLPRTERRLLPVQQGTFALVEWGVEEDPAGLEGLVEPPPEGELPYRGRERHPVPSRDLSRGAGRDEGRGEGRTRRRDEEERRGRRFPPPAEVAYEILAGAGKPLGLLDIAGTGAERLLMPEAFVRDDASLRDALLEDNRRRESAGRKPLFAVEGDTVTLVAQPEPGERVAAAPTAARATATLQDVRRTALAALRRRLRECDAPTVEHVALKLLEKLGFRDVKVAKRGREHVVCTGRRRMGAGDVRHAIRIVRSGADAGRRDVVDLRRDIAHYGAQIGIVLTAGEAAREARGDAAAAGQLPVVLLCGEALAEAFAEAGVGCVPVVVPEVDEAFFRDAAELAEREEVGRRARREERERRGSSRAEEAPAARTAEAPSATPSIEVSAEIREAAPAARAAFGEGKPADEGLSAGDAGDDAGDDDEGPETEGPETEGQEAPEGRSVAAESEGGAAGERRRRRRRRRRRGGRGRGSKDAASAAPQGAAAGQPGGEAPPAAAPPPPHETPPVPPREPTGGEGG